LTRSIIGAAFEVHRILGRGFLEAVRTGFVLRTRKAEHFLQRTGRIPRPYKDLLVGTYRADFVVDGKVILEIKGISALIAEHEAQTLHYLATTGLRLALLINFGAPSLEFERLIR
jgi:GxxExxY protein